ncbi:Hsp33 family molecular chaperone HslO [Azospirillum sp. SYSU D00513]|uniref:Hsp33 family molecular chaperone HslO n=1 Tax=Azospirillum sp. SYSU D00513 TaxID=2812561 RepID=UPI001A95C285|nr:Hsp33 family molecular chaperone HslO [Azospirillum sp. SYSU D00513]
MSNDPSVQPLSDDYFVPFQIEASQLRGRMVKVGPALDDILKRHAYPDSVARLLAETAALAVLLSSMLKYEGIFTLQTKGDGPIRLMVADVTSVGDLRCYAQFDEEAVRKAERDVDIAPAAALLGKGYIAFTVDQGQDTDRYQGIVELYGKTLADCVQHYFRQSEQIDTGLTVVADKDSETGAWRAGGIMVQRLPEDPNSHLPPSDTREDDWRRAMVLLSTATGDELLDPALPAQTLLHRLFHEDGLRAWAPTALRFGCRCSRERVSDMLASLPRAEVEELKVDDKNVEVTCQFCSTTYAFDEAELDRVYAGK